LHEAHPELDADTIAGVFGDSHSFHLALLDRLLMDSRAAVVAASADLPPGIPRLWRAAETWLDFNAARPGLREMMLAMRYEPDARARVRGQIRGFAIMMQLELKSVSWPHASATARMLTAMMVETALAEHEANRKLPDFRAMARCFLERR
jgi:hypothetical protein